MPAKKRANRNDQSRLGHQGARAEAQSTALQDQSIAPTGAIQKARTAPGLLTSHDLLQLQRTVGNRAVSKLLTSTRSPHQRSAGSVSQSRPVIQRAYYYWDYASKSFLYSYGVAAMTPGIRRYLDLTGKDVPHGGHTQTWITEADWLKVRDDRILDYYYASKGKLVSEDTPAELTAGIAALTTNPAKAAQLFQNINNFRFRYTGRFLSARLAFNVHQGDCQTLVEMYKAVAEEMHIPFQYGIQQGPLLVAPQAIHGRDTQANTEGNTAWYFDEHFWAIGAGTAYDVLFMTTTLPAMTLSTGSAQYKGVTYYNFADGRCFIKKGENALNVQLQGEGRVFASQAATTAFIDAHTDG